MPRPGPRPYECVRRAWHSDRHPPIRGSLIRETFRMMNEVHSATTRKNREWQEKLPIVVFKAEEIMYSKANSEAEYSDLNTLWDRLNDAIDTIIRRDETTESGQLLQPCIEAALILGCTPRRSSRSQRNESPRCYLKHQKPDASSVPPSSSQPLCGNRTNSSPVMIQSPQNRMNNSPVILQSPQNPTNNTPVMLQSPQSLSPSTINTSNSFLKAERQIIQNRNQIGKKPAVLSHNFAPDINQPASIETEDTLHKWPTYPLYYTNQTLPTDVKSLKPSNSYPQLMDSDNQRNCDPSDFIHPSKLNSSPDRKQLAECDLTLRLGCVVAPCSSLENPWATNGETSRALHTNDQALRFPCGRFG